VTTTVMGKPPVEPWHLSKSVPITLIAAILVQTAGMVWQAAQLNAQVGYHAQQIAELKAAEASRKIDERKTNEGLARLDERLLAQTKILERLEKALTGRL
jgi:hypothetical protein